MWLSAFKNWAKLEEISQLAEGQTLAKLCLWLAITYFIRRKIYFNDLVAQCNTEIPEYLFLEQLQILTSDIKDRLLLDGPNDSLLQSWSTKSKVNKDKHHLPMQVLV